VHGGAPAGWLELSANLAPHGTPAAVAAAIAAQAVGAYADLDPSAAERHLAREAGVPRAAVMLTAGATEALRIVMTALVAPRDTVMIAGPTYGEYARAAELRGASVDEVRAAPPSFVHRAAALARRARTLRPALVVVCEPNNPTGRSIGRAAMARLARELPANAHLLVDESFLPFAQDRPRGVAGLPRTIAMRSLTKILAAPGIRAGYVVAEPRVLRRLRAVRDPWPVGAHACAAAAAASWRVDPSLRREVIRWRAATADLLRRERIEPVPSRANFVLGHAGAGARRLVDALARRRIAVRWCASFGLPEHIRVAVRPPEDQERLAAALREIRA
jgi:histidinol-phosphate/aromatic aminotransferase/cobyric acid decarboxylase-like protein